MPSEVSMNRALAFVLAVFSLALMIPLQEASSAESRESPSALCQFSLTGLVSENSPRVSISVTYGRQVDELRETTLTAQFQTGTKAGDVLALLADRLERSGAKITRSTHSFNLASLFVEDVVSVRIEETGGLYPTVTFCDRPLGVLSLKPTRSDRVGGELKITGLLVDSDGKSRELKKLEVEVFRADTGHTICKRLYDASLYEGWLPFRAQTDQWSPNRRKDSKVMESTEISFSAKGWALELTAG